MLVLFGSASADTVFATAILSLASIYALHQPLGPWPQEYCTIKYNTIT